MDRKDLIDMAIDAGATDCANPDKWGIFEISYEGLERFANIVTVQARKQCENEGLEKALIDMWAFMPKQWVGLTDEEIDHAAEQSDNYSSFIAGALFAQDKLEEKNGG